VVIFGAVEAGDDDPEEVQANDLLCSALSTLPELLVMKANRDNERETEDVAQLKECAAQYRSNPNLFRVIHKS
jgi:hypothetical protein